MDTATSPDPARSVLRTWHERVVAAYWQHRPEALRSYLRQLDGDGEGDSCHDHCGLGDYDPRRFAAENGERESLLLSEMHRLESAQSEALLSFLGEVGPEARILDAGAGRGGTSLAAYRRFGCHIDGVDIARAQVDCARQLAARAGCAERVRFHYQNLSATDFPDGHYDRVIANEVTMYVELDDACAEFARLLKPGGRLVLFTWCRNDAAPPRCPQTTVIDANNVCRTHQRGEYLKALFAHGLSTRSVVDLTRTATPYFELRRQMRAFGSEESADEAYRTGYRDQLISYLAVVAERAPRD